jgi:hypothetical protein
MHSLFRRLMGYVFGSATTVRVEDVHMTERCYLEIADAFSTHLRHNANLFAVESGVMNLVTEMQLQHAMLLIAMYADAIVREVELDVNISLLDSSVCTMEGGIAEIRDAVQSVANDLNLCMPSDRVAKLERLVDNALVWPMTTLRRAREAAEVAKVEQAAAVEAEQAAAVEAEQAAAVEAEQAAAVEAEQAERAEQVERAVESEAERASVRRAVIAFWTAEAERASIEADRARAEAEQAHTEADQARAEADVAHASVVQARVDVAHAARAGGTLRRTRCSKRLRQAEEARGGSSRTRTRLRVS